MRARHGGWATRSRLSLADFCSRAPEFPWPEAPGPWAWGGLPCLPLSWRSRPQRGSAPRGALPPPPPSTAGAHPVSRPPLHQACLHPGGWLYPGPPRAAKHPAPARPPGKGLAPGSQGFPNSCTQPLPYSQPLHLPSQPKAQKNPTATKTWSWDLLKYTTGASPQRVFGTWVLPDGASFYTRAPLWKGSTGNSQIQTPDIAGFTILLPVKL